LADMAEQAARLCKADLVTGMVGEFPELQGVMGGYYARAQGHPDAVADAIRDHYKPVGQGDDVPTAPVTVAVSLADKLDTLFSFFLVRLVPTGSKDPFALRRAAMGVIALLTRHDLRLSLAAIYSFLWPLWKSAFGTRLEGLGSYESLSQHDWFPAYELSQDKKQLRLFYKEEKQASWDVSSDELPVVEAWLNVLFGEEIGDTLLLDFFADRLKVQQREAGVRHDLIDAVFALGQETGDAEDDLVRLLARVKALQSFVERQEGRDLLAGYKRAANILKKENWTVTPAKAGVQESSVEGLDPGLRRDDDLSKSDAAEPEEQALIAALDSAEPRARAAVAEEDFEGAMAALASLRGPVDAFFEKVTVNDADPAKRAARLALLARMRDAVHQVADFSRIEG
jgi:glycyl-tRNA synthetase beta chain